MARLETTKRTTSQYGRRKAPAVKVVGVLARVFLLPFFRIYRQGHENLPDEGPFVLLPKHQRWEDIPLLSLAAPCPLLYVAKHELFVHPFSRWLMTALGGIPLNRQRPLKSRGAIRNLRNMLERGERIVVFPEGTYYRGRMGPGHMGLIRLIHSQTRIPYVPVGISYGTGKLRQSVHIRFGRAILGEPSISPEALVERIMKEIAGLSGFSGSSRKEVAKRCPEWTKFSGV
jgi:1-acyl-sn-glycerol-3-phosphate acyltransferase